MCAGPGVDVQAYRLTHGVHVRLCAGHRGPAFVRQDEGRAFTTRLRRLWHAAGGVTCRQRAALQAHEARIADADLSRERPGSYSWPVLRGEAERRFAAGEPAMEVITELRVRHRDGDAIVPSVRTMQRWFAQGRWLASGPGRAPGHANRYPDAPPQTLVEWVDAAVGFLAGPPDVLLRWPYGRAGPRGPRR